MGGYLLVNLMAFLRPLVSVGMCGVLGGLPNMRFMGWGIFFSPVVARSRDWSCVCVGRGEMNEGHEDTRKIFTGWELDIAKCEVLE